MANKKILTKKNLRALESALTLDDILYEKFRQLNLQLRKREEEFQRSQSVLYVLLKRGKFLYQRRVSEIHHSPQGMTVVISD